MSAADRERMRRIAAAARLHADAEHPWRVIRVALAVLPRGHGRAPRPTEGKVVDLPLARG